MRHLLPALALVLVSSAVCAQAPSGPPPPGGNILARLDCTASFPACGWGYSGNEQHYSLARVGNGARFTLTPGSAATLTQFYTGWSTDLAASEAPAIYLRMHLTVHGPINTDGVGDTWTNKFVIVNDRAKSQLERAIVELRPEGVGKLAVRIQRNIDGEEAGTRAVDLPTDRRVALQFEIRRGANGRVALWLDNANPAKPTAASPRFDFDISRWANVNVGYYQNASLAANGRVAYTVEDVVVADAFDPAFR